MFSLILYMSNTFFLRFVAWFSVSVLFCDVSSAPQISDGLCLSAIALEWILSLITPGVYVWEGISLACMRSYPRLCFPSLNGTWCIGSACYLQDLGWYSKKVQFSLTDFMFYRLILHRKVNAGQCFILRRGPGLCWACMYTRREQFQRTCVVTEQLWVSSHFHSPAEFCWKVRHHHCFVLFDAHIDCFPHSISWFCMILSDFYS